MSYLDSGANARYLPVLYRLGKLVTASLDLDSTLDAIVDAAHQLIGADSTAILLYDEDNDDSLAIRIGRGGIVSSVGERVRVQSSLAGRALREGRAVLVEDMLTEAERARPDLDKRSGTRSYLAAPLIWRGEPLGVVTIGSAQPGVLGDEQVQLVSELAEHAAAAVAHARAYAEERQRRQHGEVLVRQLADRTAELERLQHQLVQNEKLTAIGQLVQGLGHEMNTPLSIVITNLSVLGRHVEKLTAIARSAERSLPGLLADPLAAAVAAPIDAAVQGADLAYTLQDLPDLLNESTAAARRLADMVRSMGNFARRDTGGPGRVAIREAMEAALSVASNRLMQCAQVVREYEDTPPVLGLASELTEVFVHLLINAAQALEDAPGIVTLTTSYADGLVVVRIRDTGGGIAAEHLPRVFDPFFTTRPPGHGTGMGLAVCYGIVARHGGSIAVDSQLGGGTSVTVRLPAAARELVAA